MSILGAVHLGTSLLAMATGAIVLLTGPKGGTRHRQWGWVYLGSMLALNVSALFIYKLFGGFGPFHVAAIVSLVGVVLGGGLAVAARRARERGEHARRANLLDGHYRAIAWSYIGLMAAFLSEAATRLDIARPDGMPGREFGIAVGLATAVVVGVGAHLVRTRHARLLAPFAPRGR